MAGSSISSCDPVRVATHVLLSALVCLIVLFIWKLDMIVPSRDGLGSKQGVFGEADFGVCWTSGLYRAQTVVLILSNSALLVVLEYSFVDSESVFRKVFPLHKVRG